MDQLRGAAVKCAHNNVYTDMEPPTHQRIDMILHGAPMRGECSSCGESVFRVIYKGGKVFSHWMTDEEYSKKPSG